MPAKPLPSDLIDGLAEAMLRAFSSLSHDLISRGAFKEHTEAGVALSVTSILFVELCSAHLKREDAIILVDTLKSILETSHEAITTKQQLSCDSTFRQLVLSLSSKVHDPNPS